MSFSELIKKEWFRNCLVLIVGITIGAVFYPTKHIEEKISQKYESEISVLKEQYSSEIQDISESLKEQISINKRLSKEYESDIKKLRTEIKNLQSKQKTAYYKLVKPDGTIEIRKFTESEVSESSKVITEIQEEYKVKVEEIENKWSSIHKERVETLAKEFKNKESEYQKKIFELEQSKVVSVNPKRFGLEVGMLTDKKYYGHASMDLWGPVFIGVHGEVSDNDDKVGLGVGLRF